MSSDWLTHGDMALSPWLTVEEAANMKMFSEAIISWAQSKTGQEQILQNDPADIALFAMCTVKGCLTVFNSMSNGPTKAQQRRKLRALEKALGNLSGTEKLGIYKHLPHELTAPHKIGDIPAETTPEWIFDTLRSAVKMADTTVNKYTKFIAMQEELAAQFFQPTAFTDTEFRRLNGPLPMYQSKGSLAGRIIGEINIQLKTEYENNNFLQESKKLLDKKLKSTEMD